MPGEDFAESMRVVLGELGELPHLAELPDRGAHAAMTGRSLAVVNDLGIDLQPAGWRLTDASGVDHRRAISLLSRDLDTVEELAAGHTGRFKLQIAGPWTLASTVERPRGDRVLADHGARRDLAQALAEGVSRHVAEVRGRLSRADGLVVQIDEPALPAVLAARVPTASGFGRHRAVTPPDAARALGWVLEAARAAGAATVVHCCAPDVPFDVLRETSAEAISLDQSLVGTDQYDDVAAWVEAGRQVWPSVIPSVDPATPPDDRQLTLEVLRWWAGLGFSEVETLPGFVVTPTCGLAAASPSWARKALGLAAGVARNVSAEQGRMEP